LRDLVKLLASSGRCCVLAQVFDEGLSPSKILGDVLDTLTEECIELIAAPLNTVLDLIRIQPERAKRNFFFGRVTRVTIG
jgi:hypothetical protein